MLTFTYNIRDKILEINSKFRVKEEKDKYIIYIKDTPYLEYDNISEVLKFFNQIINVKEARNLDDLVLKILRNVRRELEEEFLKEEDKAVRKKILQLIDALSFTNFKDVKGVDCEHLRLEKKGDVLFFHIDEKWKLCVLEEQEVERERKREEAKVENKLFQYVDINIEILKDLIKNGAKVTKKEEWIFKIGNEEKKYLFIWELKAVQPD